MEILPYISGNALDEWIPSSDYLFASSPAMEALGEMPGEGIDSYLLERHASTIDDHLPVIPSEGFSQ